MVSHLTNNETYFYREMPQLQVFADHVLRQLKERKARAGDRTLRILSAGCSTGEEAHTLAMIVYDSGQFFWNWDVQVIGLDVDPAALEKARRGRLPPQLVPLPEPGASWSGTSCKQGTGAQVKEAIRSMVQLPPGQPRGARELRGPGPAGRRSSAATSSSTSRTPRS